MDHDSHRQSSVLPFQRLRNLRAARWMGVSVIALAGAAVAAPPQGTPATPQNYFARIQSAKPGDVIVLSDGAYGVLNLYGKKVAEPGLRIEVAKGAKAVFTSIGIQASEGIQLRGVEVDLADKPFAVMVTNSSRLRFVDLKVRAPGVSPSSAMMLRNSDHLAVTNCEITDIGTGINFLDSDHVDITNNRFSDVEVDAIRGSGSNIDVEGNTASSFHPRPGDHPDFIQFWGSKTHSTDGNVIKNNVYERGAGDVAQGIFIEDNQNITIVGNALVGTMYNAISLARVSSALIEDNFVQGYADMGTRIIVRGKSSGVVIRHNKAQAILNYEHEGPNPGYKEDHNSMVQPARVGDTSAMKAWLSAHRGD